MARSLFGVDKSDLNAYLNHMQKAVVYTHQPNHRHRDAHQQKRQSAQAASHTRRRASTQADYVQLHGDRF